MTKLTKEDYARDVEWFSPAPLGDLRSGELYESVVRDKRAGVKLAGWIMLFAIMTCIGLIAAAAFGEVPEYVPARGFDVCMTKGC